MFEIIVFFLLGLIFGSFANVLIFRLPREKSVIFPFSFCPSCNKKIKWYDNIPVLSFILLRGKCRACGSKISLQYPLVEIIMGILFALVVNFLGITSKSIALIFLLFNLVVIAFIDFKWRIIPDEINLSILVAGIIYSLYKMGLLRGIVFSLTGSLVGFLFLLLTAHIGDKVFKKESLGGGDIKLIAGLGTFLGAKNVFVCIFLSSILGIFYAVPLYFMSKKRKKEIPFGPFIMLAGLISFLFKINIFFKI